MKINVRLLELAFSMADGTFRSIMEGVCVPVGGGWFDSLTANRDSEIFKEALEYIQLRGDDLSYKVVRHPECSHWFRVENKSIAQEEHQHD